MRESVRAMSLGAPCSASPRGPRRRAIALAVISVVGAILAPLNTIAQQWTDQRWEPPILLRAAFPLDLEAAALADLRRLPADLHELLDVGTSNEPVELYLFADKASYARHMAQRWPGVPNRRAMFVKGSGPGMVFAFRNPEFAIDLRHETIHALLHAVLPGVPLWLDEGLAEYFEVPAAERARGNPHLAGMNWSLRLGLIRQLGSLERKIDLADMGRAEYRDAWAWVHFMLHGPPEAREELLAYLRELRTNDHPEPLSRRLERRLPGLDRRFATHFKEWGE
jgi:hypothetical protein